MSNHHSLIGCIPDRGAVNLTNLAIGVEMSASLRRQNLGLVGAEYTDRLCGLHILCIQLSPLDMQLKNCLNMQP